MRQRPTNVEYSAYQEQYVSLVGEGSITDILAEQAERTIALLSSITEEQANYRYAPGKWTLKEVIGHISDNERVMSYRLLRIARGDKTPLPGYDQDDFMKEAPFQSWTLSQVIEDYASVRRATLTLVRGLSDEALLRTGIANDSAISARALAYINAGHELHHLRIIQEKYLAN
jgi:hypothetical protein